MREELKLWINKIFILIILGMTGYFIYEIRGILFTILISLFLMIIINPIIQLGVRYHIPAWISLTGIYITVLILGSIVIGTLIPIVISYVTDTISTIIAWANTAKEVYTTSGIQWFHFHPYIEKGILFLFGEQNIDHTLDIIKQNAGNIQLFLTSQISSITSWGLTIMSQVWGIITEWILIGTITFLLVLEREAIAKYGLWMLSEKHQKQARDLYKTIENVFQTWLKAMLILSGSIFLLTYTFLVTAELMFHFSLEKTFTLALIWGIMEFIPYIWPIIALIPAVIIGLGISWKVAIIITVIYIAIQQIENNFLVPYVMSKNLNLSPVFVFLMMLIWASIGGIIGIILAVPIAAIIKIAIESYKSRNQASDLKGGAKKVPTPRKKMLSPEDIRQ